MKQAPASPVPCYSERMVTDMAVSYDHPVLIIYRQLAAIHGVKHDACAAFISPHFPT